ncbi:Uncharacterized protein GBIM_00179, partial [Gryllus bimaculatus]
MSLLHPKKQKEENEKVENEEVKGRSNCRKRGGRDGRGEESLQQEEKKKSIQQWWQAVASPCAEKKRRRKMGEDVNERSKLSQMSTKVSRTGRRSCCSAWARARRRACASWRRPGARTRCTPGSVAQGAAGVLDEFAAPAQPSGAGRADALFFADANHSRVSLMARMAPSPDWFVGLDSFELCVGGAWLDSITLEADPLDAGTDNGFTFTAPNWPTEPQGTVYRVTSRFPPHPAGSFYYPSLRRLPAIAAFTFRKIREFELTSEAGAEAGTGAEAPPLRPPHRHPRRPARRRDLQRSWRMEARAEAAKAAARHLHHDTTTRPPAAARPARCAAASLLPPPPPPAPA